MNRAWIENALLAILAIACAIGVLYVREQWRRVDEMERQLRHPPILTNTIPAPRCDADDETAGLCGARVRGMIDP